MFGKEGRKRRKQHGARQIACDIDTKQPCHRSTYTPGGILNIREDRDASAIIGLALRSWLNMSRGPMQQTAAEPSFKRFDGGGRNGRETPRSAAAALKLPLSTIRTNSSKLAIRSMSVILPGKRPCMWRMIRLKR